jgi:hypothetical protein
MPKTPTPAPVIGSIWAKDGKGYTVIDSGFQTKDPDSGRWHPGVMYKLTNEDGQRKVRQQEDFLKKFQPAAPTSDEETR